MEEVDSTNKYAKEHFAELNDFTIIYTDNQTAGRGRLERKWQNTGADNIYASILIKPNCEISNVFSNLTQYLCLVLAETFEEYGVNPQIKWPNDIVADGKKVCGILTEGVISPNKNKAVVGIGINVANKSFGDELSDKASSIYMLTGKVFERESIINNLLEEFEKTYTDFIEGKTFISDYEKLCININRQVTFVKEGEETSGIAVNVAENGELVIKKEDGTTLNINSGEVSVRGIYGYY